MDGAKFLALGAALLAAGCTLAPAYHRPPSPVPAAFPAGPDGEAYDAAWRDFFTDPGMRAVITLALEHNRDLRVAALNVERAQAFYRIQRGALSPNAGIQASGSKYRSPERVNRELYNEDKAMVLETDSVNFGILSWEVDFFGRLRSLKDQALNQYLATTEAREAARITLAATVAQAYLACAADRENLDLAQATFETQKGVHDLLKRSFEAGLASELDLRQAQGQMEAARADAARYRAQVAVDLDALELLAGAPVPQDLRPRGLDAAGELKDVPAGLSSGVLLRRPDLRMAEYQLRAANADIGAARAAFFPRVSLTAGIGTMSPDAEHLFASGTRTWSFTPQILAPLFAGGALRAGLKVSEVDRDIAVAHYEKAIQSAFTEVADGLHQRAALAEQVEAQRALVGALESAFTLSEARYRAGLDGYLGVLVAQRSLYGARQGLVAVRLARRLNQIGLYKALAGRLEGKGGPDA